MKIIFWRKNLYICVIAYYYQVVKNTTEGNRKMKNLRIENKSDLIKALEKSERVQIQDTRKSTYGIIIPPKLDTYYVADTPRSRLDWMGYIQAIQSKDFIEKTDWGLYLVQGITMHRMFSSFAINEDDAMKTDVYKEEIRKGKGGLLGKLMKKYLFVIDIHADRSISLARDYLMKKMKDDLKTQMTYKTIKDEFHDNYFYVGKISNPESFQSKLFSPTDEVIALYD